MTKKLTKAQALELFRMTHKEFMKRCRGDKVAQRTAWNDYTDALCKDGEISDYQYMNWTSPF